MVLSLQEIPVPVMAEAAFHVDLDPGVGFPELGQDPGHVVFGKHVGAGNGKGSCRMDPGVGQAVPDLLVGGFHLEEEPVQQFSF